MGRSKTKTLKREINKILKTTGIPRIKKFLIGKGIEVKGLQYNQLIILYAEQRGVEPPSENIRRWAVEYMFGWEPPKRKKKPKKPKTKNLKAIAEQFAEENRGKATPAASFFRRLLNKAGIRFKSEKIIFNHKKSFYLVDYYVPERQLCIELDGGYHDTPEQKALDQERDEWLQSKGYHNWRMTNEEALELTPEQVKEKIESYPKIETKVRILPYEDPELKKLRPLEEIRQRKIKRKQRQNECRRSR